MLGRRWRMHHRKFRCSGEAECERPVGWASWMRPAGWDKERVISRVPPGPELQYQRKAPGGMNSSPLPPLPGNVGPPPLVCLLSFPEGALTLWSGPLSRQFQNTWPGGKGVWRQRSLSYSGVANIPVWVLFELGQPPHTLSQGAYAADAWLSDHMQPARTCLIGPPPPDSSPPDLPLTPPPTTTTTVRGPRRALPSKHRAQSPFCTGVSFGPYSERAHQDLVSRARGKV